MAWSRRDQIEANQFLSRRSTSALVLAEPDHPQSPTRRYTAATITGVVGMVIVLAIFGVYGLLRPGSADKWQQAGVIIVQKDVGGQWILGADKRVYPVRNYASARLIVNAADPATVSVSAESLKKAPRGQEIGIVGAPEELPSAGSLTTAPWTICEHAVTSSMAPASTVLLGTPPAGAALTGGLLVTDTRKQTYLLAEGRRYAIGSQAVLAALNYTGATALTVPGDWLDTIPAGTDLAFPDVSGRGKKPSWSAPEGVRVGQVLQSGNLGTTVRYFLVEKAGLRPLDVTGTQLALGDPKAGDAYPDAKVSPIVVAPSALIDVPVAAARTIEPSYPSTPPVLADVSEPGATAVCAQVTGTGGQVALSLVSIAELTARAPLPVTAPANRPREVAVPSGTGALVRAGGAGGMVYLVTDQGRRFPVPNPEARTALGYGSVTPVDLPVAVIGLLPVGPALDRAAASRPSTD